jgi:hypothetical protein
MGEEKYWDEIPSRPAEEVLSKIAKKLETLEWVPYYDPDDAESEAFMPADGRPYMMRTKPLLRRKLVENPIVFQNIWPGGERFPDDLDTAIEVLQSESGGGGNGLLQRINHWRALQMHYVDSGWGTDAWDGDAFWERRVAWVRQSKALEREKPEGRWNHDRSEWLEPEHSMMQEWENRYFDFFKQSAGDRAVSGATKEAEYQNPLEFSERDYTTSLSANST